jgi:hypothetical protein
MMPQLQAGVLEKWKLAGVSSANWRKAWIRCDWS